MKSRIVDLKKIDSPNFLIFVQGSWEIGKNERNVAASEGVIEEGIASTVLYESSRDLRALDKATTPWDWISAFNNKTYQDELKELRELIDYVNKEYGPVNLFLSGSSYGGGLVTLVSGDVSNLTRMLLCCPQIICPDELKQANIYKDFPKERAFLGAISRYKGRVILIHGNNDKKVPIDQSESLYNAAKTMDKKLVILDADHTFTDTAREMYVREHISAFR